MECGTNVNISTILHLVGYNVRGRADPAMRPNSILQHKSECLRWQSDFGYSEGFEYLEWGIFFSCPGKHWLIAARSCFMTQKVTQVAGPQGLNLQASGNTENSGI